MNLKTISLYIFQTIIGFAGHLIGLIVYPLAFLFRHKVLAWANSKLYEDEVNHVYVCRKGVRWYHFIHPYFVLFWFFTGLDNEHAGPEWFMKKLKVKWYFDTYHVDSYYMFFNFKQHLQYFYLCYCWEAFRNGFYNWNMLLRGGKYKEGTVKVIKDTANLPLLTMPQPVFKDGYLLYDFQVQPGYDGLTTHEGSKLMTFTTYKGHKRFYYGYCRIHRLKRYLLIVNIMFGWGWFNGIRETKLKFIFKKLDEKTLSDYETYLKSK